MPKAFLKPLKQDYSRFRDVDDVFAYGSALAAIGHRHKRYRQEISKFMQRAEAASDDPVQKFATWIGKTLPQSLDEDKLEALRAYPQQEANLLVNHLARDHVGTQRERAYLEGLPDSVKLALMFGLPLPLSESKDDFTRTVFYLPTVARMQARDFYLPENERQLLPAPSKQDEHAVLYLEARRKASQRRKPTPSQAPERPGRNDPCPCGSGSKYKRCCGGA